MKKNVMKSVSLTALVAIALLGKPCRAQHLLNDTLRVDEVVVTGTRTPLPGDRVPRKMEMLNAGKIEQSNKENLGQVLKSASGVDIIEYPGILSGVSIRGFRPEIGGLNNKVLILIDGRPAASTNLGLIPSENIERIEVLRGPASALYGPRAMGGVINVITKKTTKGIHGKANVLWGSFNNSEFGASAGGSIVPSLNFDAAFSHKQYGKDFTLGKGNFFRGMLDGDMVTNRYKNNDSTSVDDDKRGDGQVRENTTYIRYNGMLRIGYRVNENVLIQAKYDNTTADNVESPGDIKDGNNKPGLKDLQRHSLELSADVKVNSSDNIQARVFAGTETSNTFTVYEGKEFTRISPYNSFNEKYLWRGTQANYTKLLYFGTLTAGFDYNEAIRTSEKFDKTGKAIAPYNPDAGMFTVGGFTQANFQFFNKRLDGSLGLRLDHNQFRIYETEIIDNDEQNGDNIFFSPSLALQYKITPWLRARTSIGRGYSPADIYYLAGYSETVTKKNHVSVTQGNKKLKNLESITWDAGFELAHLIPGLKLEVGYFNTKFKNNAVAKMETLKAIQTTATGDTIDAITTYVNAKESLIHGLELAISYNFSSVLPQDYNLNISLAWDKMIEANEIVDEYKLGEMEHRILNVADNNVRASIDFSMFEWLRCGLSGRYKGFRYDRNWSFYTQYVEVRYAPYLVMDAYIGTTLFKYHSLDLFVHNLTDENYYEKRGFNLPGRAINVKYTFSF